MIVEKKFNFIVSFLTIFYCKILHLAEFKQTNNHFPIKAAFFPLVRNIDEQKIIIYIKKSLEQIEQE
jgi:hypothetical protein